MMCKIFYPKNAKSENSNFSIKHSLLDNLNSPDFYYSNQKRFLKNMTYTCNYGGSVEVDVDRHPNHQRAGNEEQNDANDRVDSLLKTWVL